MFRNYLKVALRNLVKHKVYAGINIFGLAIGIACCILIYLFVRDELSYDAFHEHKDRIYCAVQQFGGRDGTQTFTSGVSNAAGPMFKDDLPEVQEYVRIWYYRDVVRHEGTPQGEFLTFVDPSFLDVFTFPLISGDPETALSANDAIVLTEKTARRYYGSADPVGQVLRVKLGREFHAFTVTAVARDAPGNSSVVFNFLLPLERACDIMGDKFFDPRRVPSFSTFLVLDEPASSVDLAPKLNAIAARYTDTTIFRQSVRPLTSLHLDETNRIVARGVSDPRYSYILTGLGLLVLLVACFNFMNLSVARSATRAKEIGVRKVVGAQRAQLLGQFWSEALMLSAAALLVGVALAELLLPTFNSLAHKQLNLDYGTNLSTLLVLAGICLVTGLLAGSYPALVLSGLRPIEVLRQRMKIGGTNLITRLLIVAQFAVSICLLLGTIVMADQLAFMKAKDLGFDEQRLIAIFSDTGEEDQLFARYKNEIMQHPSVLGVTCTDASITGRHSSSCSTQGGADDLEIRNFKIDYDYLETVGLRLIEGRNFLRDHATDKIDAVLINETLAGALSPEHTVGSHVELCMRDEPYTIIGVVEDFHYRSMSYAIEPVAFHMVDVDQARYLNVQIGPEDLSLTLAFLREKWEAIAPNLPFEYWFVGEAMDQMYYTDERWSSIIGYSSVLAILIAALGLFGLSALIVKKRTREICIRKVHGATLGAVLRMILGEFVKLVAIAAVFAWPVGFWGMNRWLESFAYRINVSLAALVLSGALVLAVAVGSVGYQALKAARANPVDALKYE